MKRYLHALAMAQSMFCAIPSPFRVWDEEARPKMLLFLPGIGLEIGLLWAVLGWLCALIQLPTLLAGVALCAFPYVVTGFLHLDGFLDVVDAVRSWRDLDRRREILKDSHVGSFAVVGCVLLLLTGFAACATGIGDLRILVLIPAATRCCAAMAVMGLKPMQVSEYAVQHFEKKQILIPAAVLAVLVAAGFLVTGRYGWCPVAAAAGYGLALRRGYRSLEGMNGDISGYALTVGEVCGVVAAACLGGMT